VPKLGCVADSNASTCADPLRKGRPFGSLRLSDQAVGFGDVQLICVKVKALATVLRDVRCVNVTESPITAGSLQLTVPVTVAVPVILLTKSSGATVSPNSSGGGGGGFAIEISPRSAGALPHSAAQRWHRKSGRSCSGRTRPC
jgi:hypothetical protein